jgi:hypothetical protein
MRPIASAVLLIASSLACAQSAAISVEEIVAPFDGTAIGASITAGPDATLWLSWLEQTGATSRLRFSRFNADGKRWQEPQTIAQGAGWAVKASDFPALTVGKNERATALWSVTNSASPTPQSATGTHAHAHGGHGPSYRAFISQTIDGGKTWTPGTPLTKESDIIEFASLTPLADGRVLAAWLDGRAKAHGKPQQLFSRIIGEAGPDTLVDPSVCDCCHTSLTAFPDGTALLTYRGRSSEEIRDIRTTRFRDGRWDESRPVHQDDWKIAGCPVNGPQLASDGGRVAAAWFTAANNDPRVLVSFSANAGARFMTPSRISESKTAGRVSTILFHDGAILVTSVDIDGALWLRRVSPDFAPSAPVQLTTPSKGRVKGFPRMALLRDYVGGTNPAQLMVTFVTDEAPTLRTLLVTVPEAELLLAEKSCDCEPTTEELRGFPIRGTFIESTTHSSTVRAKHFEVPGIFAEGAREFRADPSAFASAPRDQQFVARIERRDGEWWLISPRFIASAPSNE